MESQLSPNRTLFIIGRHPSAGSLGLLPRSATAATVSIVLVQDAVLATNVPAPSVQVLAEDLESRHGVSPYPQISYAALLQMMFHAQRVIVL